MLHARQIGKKVEPTSTSKPCVVCVVKEVSGRLHTYFHRGKEIDRFVYKQKRGGAVFFVDRERGGCVDGWMEHERDIC